MKVLNTENMALNGRPVTEEVKDVSKAIGAGLGALKNDDSKEKDDFKETVISEADATKSKK
jgi:hypothetical protein